MRQHGRFMPFYIGKLKRKVFETLAIGVCRQLVWFGIITILVLTIGFVVEEYVFVERPLGWSGLMSLFFDPSGFADDDISNARTWFRFAVSFFGFFFFSILLVSVLTNIFDNISDSVKSGRSHYRFKKHVLVLGAGHQLNRVLSAVKSSGKSVVVISNNDLELDKRFVFYRGDFSDEKLLKLADVVETDSIYLIGDDGDLDHDSRSLLCLQHLKKIFEKGHSVTHCYVTLRERTSFEVLYYQKLNFSNEHLLVDIINEYEFIAEQLLVERENLFLPVLGASDDKRSHVFLLGANAISSALAYTVAHISHYPNFASKGLRTCITIMDADCRSFMEELVSARPGLFELSRYVFLDSDGHEEVHVPEGSSGDFLDVVWRFVEATPESAFARDLLTRTALNKAEAMSICACYEDSNRSLNVALHLPRVVYGKGEIAVYWPNESKDVIDLANSCGMYGHLQVFGGLDDVAKYAHSERIKRGQRVNAVYANEGKAMSQSEAESLWYHESEYNKNSSVYCANAMNFRRKCFGSDELEKFSEVEHCRWMESVLLMGLFAGPQKDKEHFVHPDIVPFDKLPKEKQLIDEHLVKNRDYIIKGIV